MFSIDQLWMVGLALVGLSAFGALVSFIWRERKPDEAYYNRWDKRKRVFLLLILIFLVATLAAAVVPRWDNLKHNLNKSQAETTKSVI